MRSRGVGAGRPNTPCETDAGQEERSEEEAGYNAPMAMMKAGHEGHLFFKHWTVSLSHFARDELHDSHRKCNTMYRWWLASRCVINWRITCVCRTAWMCSAVLLRNNPEVAEDGAVCAAWHRLSFAAQHREMSRYHSSTSDASANIQQSLTVHSYEAAIRRRQACRCFKVKQKQMSDETAMTM